MNAGDVFQFVGIADIHAMFSTKISLEAAGVLTEQGLVE